MLLIILVILLLILNVEIKKHSNKIKKSALKIEIQKTKKDFFIQSVKNRKDY